MIRRWLLLALLFVPLFAGHVIVTGRAAQERIALPVDLRTPANLPAPLLRISALEFKGLLADFLFLKAHVFIGGTHERTNEPRVTEEEWRWVLGMLKASTDLDPVFLDPYYLANSQLTWDAGLVKEANLLLAQGSTARPWDWLLLFYQGFNHFYFLEDDQTASELLMEASHRPDAPPMIASLASRLAYQGSRTANAITFLEGLLAKEEDEKRREEYQLRLQALRSVTVLEQALEYFRGEFQREPLSLAELREAGILRAVPVDPYGGEFYLDEQGRVKTTSDLRMVKKEPRDKPEIVRSEE